MLRDSKALIISELIVVFALAVVDLVPFSATPLLLILGWISLRLRRRGWRSVGMQRPTSWSRTLLLGVAVGVGYQFFCLYALEPLIVLLTHKPIDLDQFAQIKGNIFLLVLFLLLIWTLAAFGEELVYRGYLMNRVAELGGGSKLAWGISLVLVSLLFGIVHVSQGISGVINNTLAGCVYAALYLLSGRNLWAPIIAHGVYDTVALLLIYSGRYPGL